MSETFRDLLTATGLLPLVVIDDPDSARDLAGVFRDSDLPIVEVTLRTERALDAVARIADDGTVCVGVGTVLDAGQVDAAAGAGARFVVTPGTDWQVIDACRQRSLPVVPGVATATEIQAVRAAGFDLVKFFPAASLGGPPAIQAMSGVFPGLDFIPTGGITQQTARSYLDVPAVRAVGGSWMAPRDAIRRRDLDEIARLCRAARAAARDGRRTALPAAGGTR
jgi:2-dehydro-3-deoxyphosphogluconate aldolase/(4S)-4-hydroxy-2-oxoglutarate aldolase